ncbi:MAG: response regulator transcription factor [Deltaproteobacteria bacterium]|nr:response regulator transcription factor [Deltaproteobacteria bacterium]
MVGVNKKGALARKKGRLLVIDDEKWICESLSLLLSRRGLHVDSALSGNEALKFVKKELVDLVILDYNLPDMTGLDVLAAIREIAPDLPVLFMTGHGSETISIKAFKLGISDYFIKPFDPKILIEKVLDIVGERKDREATFFAGLPLQPDFDDELIEDSKGIGRAVKYLNDNYKTRITLEEVANVAGVSRYHFTRLFKKVMGISFTNYLNYFRVKKAEEALSQQDANISEIAFSVGFNSLRQFERAFKTTLGQTAAEYRRDKYPEIY